MKLPELEKPDRYVGLYIIDFGDHTGLGFTAQEVAEILESERYKDCKVYKIHNACPDGKLELKGVNRQVFDLESGMFFYLNILQTARQDFKKLVDLAVTSSPPCRAKVHLAKYSEDKFCVALIYPAEFDNEISSWLLDCDYQTAGPAEGGTGAVERYYSSGAQILERHQLFGQLEIQSRTGEELLASLQLAVQR